MFVFSWRKNSLMLCWLLSTRGTTLKVRCVLQKWLFDIQLVSCGTLNCFFSSALRWPPVFVSSSYWLNVLFVSLEITLFCVLWITHKCCKLLTNWSLFSQHKLSSDQASSNKCNEVKTVDQTTMFFLVRVTSSHEINIKITYWLKYSQRIHKIVDLLSSVRWWIVQTVNKLDHIRHSSINRYQTAFWCKICK